MKVVVNGREMDLPDGCAVTGLLDALGLTGRPVAVEVNREVVPGARHHAVMLKDGDRLEVVTLVGGG